VECQTRIILVAFLAELGAAPALQAPPFLFFSLTPPPGANAAAPAVYKSQGRA